MIILINLTRSNQNETVSFKSRLDLVRNGFTNSTLEFLYQIAVNTVSFS